MIIIIDINEYRKKEHEADMIKLAEMTETLFTHGAWKSKEDETDFMLELSRLSEIEESVWAIISRNN